MQKKVKIKVLFVLCFKLPADYSLGMFKKTWLVYNQKHATFYLSENSFIRKGAFVSPLNQLGLPWNTAIVFQCAI